MARTPTDAADDAALPVPFAWQLKPEDVPAGGRDLRHEASRTERAALAAALGLEACERLELAGRVRNLGAGAYHLSARLTADVVQACVVTLAPVAATIDEPVEIEFRPPDAVAEQAGALDLETATDIEPIEQGRMNLGRIAVETLSAALDPYPRAPAASFTWRAGAGAGAPASPFQVLDKLKRKP
jgi:hypothetical protein